MDYSSKGQAFASISALEAAVNTDFENPDGVEDHTVATFTPGFPNLLDSIAPRIMNSGGIALTTDGFIVVPYEAFLGKEILWRAKVKEMINNGLEVGDITRASEKGGCTVYIHGVAYALDISSVVPYETVVLAKALVPDVVEAAPTRIKFHSETLKNGEDIGLMRMWGHRRSIRKNIDIINKWSRHRMDLIWGRVIRQEKEYIITDIIPGDIERFAPVAFVGSDGSYMGMPIVIGEGIETRLHGLSASGVKQCLQEIVKPLRTQYERAIA